MLSVQPYKFEWILGYTKIANVYLVNNQAVPNHCTLQYYLQTRLNYCS